VRQPLCNICPISHDCKTGRNAMSVEDDSRPCRYCGAGRRIRARAVAVGRGRRTTKG
jgi:hypothetical protein